MCAEEILSTTLNVLETAKWSTVLVANVLVYSLDSALSLCAWTGMCITWLIYGTFSGTISALVGFSTLVQVLYEDFEYFLNDALCYLQGVWWTAYQFLEILFTALERLMAIPDVVKKSLGRITNYSLLQDVIHIFKILNGSIILIGSLIWAVPETLAYLVFNSSKNIVWIIVFIFELLTNLIIKVPYESALGLIFGVLVFRLNSRYGIRRQFWEILKKTSRSFCTAVKEFRVDFEVVVFRLKRVFKNLIRFKNSEISRSYTFSELKRKMMSAPSKIELIAQLEKEREQKLCIVCFDRQRDVMLVDCRHMCMCQSCAIEIYVTTAECPICRKRISQFMNVFT